MATTINSGYANSPKLTANIADHADVYGGRALVFDGVTDYLTCGTGLGNQLGNGYSKDTGLTASLWFKNDGTTDGGLFQIGNNGGAGEFSFQKDNNNDLYFLLNGNGWHRKVSFTDTSNWHHIVCIYGSSEANSKIYLDGESVGTAGGSFPSTLDFSGLHTTIGNYWNLAYRFNGKITDVKVFNTELTEAQVTELYKKPENTPSSVQNNLVAWYPMIEGNPESPQSIVYDCSEKKLGSSEITSASNTTFSGVTSNDWTSSGATKSFSNDQMVFTMDGDSPAVVGQLSAGNFAGGSGIPQKFLKVTLDVDSTTTGSYSINNAGGSCSADVFLKSPLTTGINTIYGVCDGASSYFRIFEVDVSTGDKLVLNSFDVKEVLMGNHATTNFFGDDLQTGTWNNSDLVGFTGASADGFTAVNTDASVGNDDNAYGDEISFVAGRTYQMSFTLAINSGSIGSIFVGVTSGTTGSADSILSYTLISSANNYSYTFTPTSTVTRRPSFRFVVNGTYNFTISNFEIKEVGISSSGFETAVNEPVVPQVPLMRYNQKMLFDGIDDKVDLGTSLPRLGTSDFSISFWLCTLTALTDKRLFGSDNSSTTQWSVHGEGTTQLRWNGGLTATSSALPSSATFNDGKLRHIVISADRSGNLIYYVDGVLLSSHDISSDSAVDLKSIRYIGTYGAGTSSFAQINIFDDFSVWNYALSATQVKELFNDGVAYDATTHSQSANLIGYWRNDGVTTWKDRSTNSNSGTVSGSPDSITIREGLNSNRDGLGFYFTNPSSNVLRLNGSSEFIAVPPTDMGLKEQITIECWLKHNTGDSSGEQIVDQYDYANNQRSFRLIIDSSEKIQLDTNDNGNANFNRYLSNSAISSIDNWRHYAVTFSSGSVIMYVDGQVQANTQTTSGGGTSIFNNTTDDLRIGSAWTGTDAGTSIWNGLLDEFRIYNRALSASEISTNYKAGKGSHKNS